MNKKFLQSLAVGALALSLLASCSHLPCPHLGFKKCTTCKKDEAATTATTTKEMKTEKKSKKSKKAKTEATEMKAEEKKN